MSRFRSARCGSFCSAVAFAIAVHIFIFGGAALADERKPVHHKVIIHGFKFSPATINVLAGDTVTWTNMDIAPHTATAKDKSWSTGTIRKGQSKSVRVGRKFMTDYFCLFHPAMKGKLDRVTFR